MEMFEEGWVMVEWKGKGRKREGKKEKREERGEGRGHTQGGNAALAEMVDAAGPRAAVAVDQDGGEGEHQAPADLRAVRALDADRACSCFCRTRVVFLAFARLYPFIHPSFPARYCVVTKISSVASLLSASPDLPLSPYSLPTSRESPRNAPFYHQSRAKREDREGRTRSNAKRTGNRAGRTARRGEHDAPAGIGHPGRGGAAVRERRVAVVFGAEDRDGVEGGWGVEEEEEEEMEEGMV